MPEFFAALAKSHIHPCLYLRGPISSGDSVEWNCPRSMFPCEFVWRFPKYLTSYSCCRRACVFLVLDAKGHRSSKSFGWTTFRRFSGLPFSPSVSACWFWNMFFEDIVCGIEMVLNSTQEVHMKSSTLCYSTWWICEKHKWCILYIDYYLLPTMLCDSVSTPVCGCCCLLLHMPPCAEPGGFRALTVAARRLVKDLRLWSGFLWGLRPCASSKPHPSWLYIMVADCLNVAASKRCFKTLIIVIVSCFMLLQDLSSWDTLWLDCLKFGEVAWEPFENTRQKW